MSPVRNRYYSCSGRFTGPVLRKDAAEGGSMSDVIYIGLTIVVFAVLFLLVRGVEHFER